VTVTVETPTHLSREQKELLKKLEDCSGEESQPKKKSFFEKLRDV
jgi:molecular chaperone DnaJ